MKSNRDAFINAALSEPFQCDPVLSYESFPIQSEESYDEKKSQFRNARIPLILIVMFQPMVFLQKNVIRGFPGAEKHSA